MTDWHGCSVENQPGKLTCAHDWTSEDTGGAIFVVDTNPPTFHRRCRMCGRIEAKQGD